MSEKAMIRWLKERGWIRDGDTWRLQTIARVHQAATIAGAMAIQERLEAGRKASGHRAMPGSGL
jgi:hypothetical protein